MSRSEKLKRLSPIFALFLCVGVLGAMRGSRAGGDIVWAAGFEPGQQEARQSGKRMLLSFHMPGCGWCRKMDAETFTDPQVVELARRFVCVRLDSEMDADLTARYRVTEFPMLILTDAQGRELVRASGYIPPERLAPALRKLSGQ
jgi:thioredoxin-related protein